MAGIVQPLSVSVYLTSKMADKSNTHKLTYQNVVAALSYFAISKPAIRIYLLLTDNPPLTVLQIATKTKIPRTTIYGLIQELADFGLVEKITDYKSHRVRAYPISILKSHIDKKREQIDQLNSSLDYLTITLTQTMNINATTEVRYYQGVTGLEQMIWNSLQAHDDVLGYSTYGRRDVVGKAFYQDFVEEFARKRIKDRVLINPNPTTLDYIRQYIKPNQHQQTVDDIRVLPESELYISGDTMIYNHTYAVAYWQKGENVGVEIDNAEFVKSQQSIFELLWKIAQPIKSHLAN